MAVEECRSYVVSRSGKVLDSSGRVLQEIVPSNIPDPRPLASFEGQPQSFFNLAALLLRQHPPGGGGGGGSGAAGSRKRKFHQFGSSWSKPVEKKGRSTCVWDEDEVGSLEDVARAILRRQKRPLGRKSSRKNLERLVQHLKVGVSQVLLLQRWEAGSREQPARWASWLLKMLRRTKPPPLPLQRFLFTVLVAILPVICCSLVCQMLNILPDPEVLSSVDLLCSALEKSWSCFSSFQWEILEERISQCRQARLKAGTWSERRSGTKKDVFPLLDSATVQREHNKLPLNPSRQLLTFCSFSVACKPQVGDTQRTKQPAGDPSPSSSSDEYAVYNDEQLSNELVLSEGVKALVRRALRERQILPSSLKKNPTNENATPVSALCPLSGNRLKIPARGISCTHLTCFDLEHFLEENAELAKQAAPAEATAKPMWRCPFCGSDATWPQIVVDGFFLRVLATLPANSRGIFLWPDGRWCAMESSAHEQVVEDNASGGDDDHGSPSASDNTASQQQQQQKQNQKQKQKQQEQQHERNVKPRLNNDDDDDDVVVADGSTWDVKGGGGLSSGSGSEVPCSRVAELDRACDVSEQAGLSRDRDHAAEARKDGAADFGAAGPSTKTTPILHEINLRDLIQSTLHKARYDDSPAKPNELLDGFKPMITTL